MKDLFDILYTKDFSKLNDASCFAHNLQFDFELSGSDLDLINDYRKLLLRLMREVDPDNPFFKNMIDK